jgi:GNAT superfamily N-acetyltransferase
MSSVTLRIRPLTPALWPALEDLFTDSPVCQRCWCMGYRIGAAYRRMPPERNKTAFKSIVQAGPPPGLLAFAGDRAVGWCQLTPREDLSLLATSLGKDTGRGGDGAPTWSLTCFYVRKRFRKQGITSALIVAAVKMARRARVGALEAYPLDGKLSPSATGSGYASTFKRAGFKVVARNRPARPICASI